MVEDLCRHGDGTVPSVYISDDSSGVTRPDRVCPRRDVIVLAEDLKRLPEPFVHAVLAHEMGHLRLLAIVPNAIFRALRLTAVPVAAVWTAITLIDLARGSGSPVTPRQIGLVWTLVPLARAFEAAGRRSGEYWADDYAAALIGPEPVAAALNEMPYLSDPEGWRAHKSA